MLDFTVRHEGELRRSRARPTNGFLGLDGTDTLCDVSHTVLPFDVMWKSRRETPHDKAFARLAS